MRCAAAYSGDWFVRQPSLTQGEFIGEQSVGVRLASVVAAQVIDGAVDDAGVVIGEASGGWRRHQPGGLGEAGRQPLEAHHVDVRDGQHPAPLVAVRIIENVKLARM
jgi:hypothetical protein